MPMCSIWLWKIEFLIAKFDQIATCVVDINEIYSVSDVEKSRIGSFYCKFTTVLPKMNEFLCSRMFVIIVICTIRLVMQSSYIMQSS